MYVTGAPDVPATHPGTAAIPCAIKQFGTIVGAVVHTGATGGIATYPGGIATHPGVDAHTGTTIEHDDDEADFNALISSRVRQCGAISPFREWDTKKMYDVSSRGE